MVRHRKQCVGVGGQIHAHYLRLLVHHVVDESRVLMRKAVMVLAPDMRGQQIVERSDGPPPRNMPCGLKPFRVLVKHRVNDVNERLVA